MISNFESHNVDVDLSGVGVNDLPQNQVLHEELVFLLAPSGNSFFNFEIILVLFVNTLGACHLDVLFLGSFFIKLHLFNL